MKVALVNPHWDFAHSIYFGCREPHFPLELAYAKALLEANGHEPLLLDGHLFGRDAASLAADIADFAPAFTIITTAPSYLFWRCAPPELRVPRVLVQALGGRGGNVIAAGPHGSVTPGATLRKLGIDAVIRGECEDAILACAASGSLSGVPGIAYREGDALRLNGPNQATRFVDVPSLAWPDEWVARHRHHHHRFDRPQLGPGAEVEASRGCPYSCSFCAKLDYRDSYRRRDLGHLLPEIDALIAQGVTYLYFIDEIFLPQRALLEALIERDVVFGVQTRLDLWKPEMIELLGKAGCVSIEAGVESLTEEGREALDKDCRLSTEALTERLLLARRCVPFVQANLIKTGADDPETVARWRAYLQSRDIWANDPVPLYPYPSSPDYRRLWGEPDDCAWERAHQHYLSQFREFSDIQEERPLPLPELETSCLPE